jgi:hypothetical protein
MRNPKTKTADPVTKKPTGERKELASGGDEQRDLVVERPDRHRKEAIPAKEEGKPD